MEDTKQHILNTLAYFDLFHYPLSEEEIHRFLGQSIEPALIDEAISSLTDADCIFRIDEFYSLQNDRSLAARRKLGNQLAVRHMVTAQKAARILSRFPYVRGLAISGSLSKNYCTEKTDIDFFIITKANRLWIARTLMHLFKKFTFLTGRQSWFCMNYYIDEAGMEIEEKNIFTATEIVTLLPMYGKASFDDFMLKNQWVKKYLPEGAGNTDHVPQLTRSFAGKFFESLFNNSGGNRLDSWFMRITRKRWLKKEFRQKKNESGNIMSMLVDKHYSKPNPFFFQNKVIEKYHARLNRLPRPAEMHVKAI